MNNSIELARFILGLSPAQVRSGGSSVFSINLRSDNTQLAYYLLIAYLIIFIIDKKKKKKEEKQVNAV